MRYLLDSDWLIDALTGRPASISALAKLNADGLAVSIIAVAGIYEGAFGTPDPEPSLAAFREFLGGYAILPVTEAIAARFAGLRAALRRQGQLIPDFDLLIATTALDSGLTLVTRNVRHFERILSCGCTSWLESRCLDAQQRPTLKSEGCRLWARWSKRHST